MTAMSQTLRSLVAQEYGGGQLAEGIRAASQIAPKAKPPEQLELYLLQLALPDLVAALEHAIVDAADEPRIRRVAGGLLTYVYSPLDLIGNDSPLSRLDDVAICAMGLLNLHESEGLELDPNVHAICELSLKLFRHLNDDLQDSIQWFLRDLEGATDAPSVGRIQA